MAVVTQDTLNFIIKKESGGNPTVASTASSASGLYGMLDSTWKSNAQAAGIDVSQYPRAKDAPAELQTKAALNYLQPNANSLEKAGLEVNGGNMEMLNFLGPKPGLAVLKADPSTPITKDFLVANGYSPDLADKAIAANKTLLLNPDGSPKTAGDLQAKVGAGGAGVGSGAPGAAGAAAAAGGAGGGAGCATAALSGIAGGVVSGLLGGAGLSAITGPLTSALGLSAIAGPLGGIMQGAVGGMIQGGISSLVSGQGLSGALSGLTSGAMGGLSSAIGGVVNSVTGSAFQQLSSLGSNILPGLTNVLPASLGNAISGGLSSALSAGLGTLMAPLNGIIQNPLNLPNAAQQFAAAGGLQGLMQQAGANMAGAGLIAASNSLAAQFGGLVNGSSAGQTLAGYQTGSALNPAQAFASTIGFTAGISQMANQIVGATAEQLAQKFGTGPGGLGAAFRNMSDVSSYGVTSLAGNLPAVSNDMMNIGNWDTSNLLRAMAPGNVAAQIINKGLGGPDGTNLTNLLIAAGVPVLNVDNPMYDNTVQKVLTQINDPKALGMVSTAFNMSTQIDHLGHLSDLSHMMPAVVNLTPNRSFRALGEHLATIGITKVDNFASLGSTLTQVESTQDLKYINAQDTPMDQRLGNQLLNTFGYGGGTFGEVTMADFIGTAAGYVHQDTVPVMVQCQDLISKHPEAAEYMRLIGLLSDTVAGKYTIQNDGGSGSDGGTPPTPPPPTIDVPTIGIFSDMDSAILAFIPKIETELTKLANTQDPVLADAISKNEQAFHASCAQLLKENHMLQAFQVNLFEPMSANPMNAYVFGMSLPHYGTNTGYGRAAHYIERVATDDKYGDMIKMTMRMARNRDLLEPLGVNVDRFQYPSSQYYRSPIDFYNNLYQGLMPVDPMMVQDQLFPQTPVDQYTDDRNRVLTDAGYDVTKLLPAQLDELYCDIKFKDQDPLVLERLGLNVVKEVVNRNIRIIGNKMYVVSLNKNMIPFATVTPDGLMIDAAEAMTATLLDLVNKVLYGNIGTTKFDNPLNTDQMIFGLVEMLAAVTPDNADALKNTLMGAGVAVDLLEKIKNAMGKNQRTLFDTSMDRNDPIAWGGAGPDDKPQRYGE